MIDCEKIRILMKNKGFLSKDFASKCFVSEATISYILAGKKEPSLRVICRMADNLGCTVDELLKGEKDDKNYQKGS